MNTMSFATAPWGTFPTDVSSPMPSQVRSPSGENQKPEQKQENDITKKKPAPARPDNR